MKKIHAVLLTITLLVPLLFLAHPVHATGGFDSSWQPCLDPALGSTMTLSNGIITSNQSNPKAYTYDGSYYDSAKKGIFPWGLSTGQCTLTAGTNISFNSTLVTKNLNSTHDSHCVANDCPRYHMFVALYYNMTGGNVHGCRVFVNASSCHDFHWMDTQVRVENINGINSPIGTQATYSGSNFFGYDQVVATTDPNGFFTMTNFNVEVQFQRAAYVWNISSTTPHSLTGIEIGTEGYHMNALVVNWTNFAFTTTTDAQVNSCRISDLNYDHAVNIIDLATSAVSFGKNLGDSGYLIQADVNQDKSVNILDLAAIAFYFGKMIPQTC